MRQKGIDSVLGAEVRHRSNTSCHTKEPAQGIGGKAGGDNSTDDREAEREYGVLESEAIDMSFEVRVVQGQHKETKYPHHQRECAQRPGKPRGDAGAHPAGSLLHFPCPYCHDTTLQG